MAGIREQLQTQMRRDGVDHINISATGETEMGKIVSPDWRKKFYVPHMGDFISARSFANWMVSGGDESLRYNTGFYKTSVPVEDFRKLLVFGKYYQLCALRSVVLNNKDALELPWVMYKRYTSGVREFDRWSNYTSIISPIVQDIVDNADYSYDWVTEQNGILRCVNTYLERITGEDFIAFELLDEISREANAARAKKHPQDDNESESQEEPQETQETV